MPLHFSIFHEKGLSGNDALLYALLCFLAKGGTATRTVAWLAGQLNVEVRTIRRSLESLQGKQLVVVNYADRYKKSVTIFLCQDGAKMAPIARQNGCPQTPLSREKENIKENIIKENKKERFSKNEEEIDLCSQLEARKLPAQAELSEEEKASIREHQMNIERKLHLVEQQTQDPGGQKRKARAAAEEAAHRPLSSPSGPTPSGPAGASGASGTAGPAGETPEQRATRLMQQAYERGRALRDIYTDKDTFDAALAKSFHNEKDPWLNEMLRRECKRGWQEALSSN